MNLLEKIENTEGHYFKQFLKTTDDYTSIISDAYLNPRKIYGKRTAKEALFQELTKQFYTPLNAYADKYIEFYKFNEFETDMVLIEEILKAIIEFKEMKASSTSAAIRKVIDDAFVEQVEKDYIETYKKINGNKKFQIYVSVIVGDVEKLVNNPELLRYFFRESIKTRKTLPIKLFKKYGFCIVTKKYDSEKGYDENWVECDVNVEVSFEKLWRDYDPESYDLGVSIKEASRIPVNNGIHRSGNLRDIIDIETNSGKKKLTFGINNTYAKAYLTHKTTTNNINTISMVAIKHGVPKTFTYIPNNTIINVSKNSVSFMSVFGHVSDGQNNIDSALKIIAICEKRYNKLSKVYLDIIKQLDELGIRSDSQLADYANYIKHNVYVMFSAVSAETEALAKEYAVSKNNTLPVSKVDKVAANAENGEKMPFFTTKFEKLTGRVLEYTKSDDKFLNTTKVKNKLQLNVLLRFSEYYSSKYLNTDVDNPINLFAEAYKLGKESFNADSEKIYQFMNNSLSITEANSIDSVESERYSDAIYATEHKLSATDISDLESVKLSQKLKTLKDEYEIFMSDNTDNIELSVDFPWIQFNKFLEMITDMLNSPKISNLILSTRSKLKTKAMSDNNFKYEVFVMLYLLNKYGKDVIDYKKSEIYTECFEVLSRVMEMHVNCRLSFHAWSRKASMAVEGDDRFSNSAELYKYVCGEDMKRNTEKEKVLG
jgi:hypothetical protein